MHDIHTARTLADAYLARDLLRREGIQATIRNEHLVGAAGGMPVNEALPTVSVPDQDVTRAGSILAGQLGDEDAASTLSEMESDSVDDARGAEAQLAMRGLFDAAQRLARNPRDGAAIDDVQRHRGLVAMTPPPFGVAPAVWQVIDTLATAVVDAAASGDEGQCELKATELRDVLRPFV